MASSSRSSSLRMCVAYGKRAAASGAHNAASSARDANAPGVYSSPDDAPHAPVAIASRTICVHALQLVRRRGPVVVAHDDPANGAEPDHRGDVHRARQLVDRRSPAPRTRHSRPRRPRIVAMGMRELPSCPTTIVVTPCRIDRLGSRIGEQRAIAVRMDVDESRRDGDAARIRSRPRPYRAVRVRPPRFDRR